MKNRNSRYIILMLAFALFLQSCKSPKQLQTAVTLPASAESILTAEAFISQSIQHRSNFDWFSANLNGRINFDGSNNTFNGQIRIKNGEQIWISVSKFGFEIARLKITTDSVFLYNKYEGTATVRDLSFFKEMTGVAFSFDMLQDILLGNYFLPESSQYAYALSEDGNHAFTNSLSTIGLMFDFLLSSTHYKFLSLTIREKSRAVRLNYEDYTTFGETWFPQKVSMQMKDPKAIDLQLLYQKVQINVPQNMPFSIPESVTKI